MKARATRSKGRRFKNDHLRDSPKATSLVGYMRASKADGSQVLDLPHDALTATGVPGRIGIPEINRRMDGIVEKLGNYEELIAQIERELTP